MHAAVPEIDVQQLRLVFGLTIDDDLPPLVASAGTFVDIVGVEGEQTTSPVTMRIPNILSRAPSCLRSDRPNR